MRERDWVLRHVLVGTGAVALAIVVFLVLELSTEVWGSNNERKADGFHWRYNVATGTVALVLLTLGLLGRASLASSRRRHRQGDV